MGRLENKIKSKDLDMYSRVEMIASLVYLLGSVSVINEHLPMRCVPLAPFL
jgi:hypothetical protein